MVAVVDKPEKKSPFKKVEVPHVPQPSSKEECYASLLAVADAMDVLNGRWKLPIMIALVDGPQRFRQIAKRIPKITDKMLSKELKEMEMNNLVTRTVINTFPPTVEYARTEYGHTLGEVLSALRNWGTMHRQTIMGKK